MLPELGFEAHAPVEGEVDVLDGWVGQAQFVDGADEAVEGAGTAPGVAAREGVLEDGVGDPVPAVQPRRQLCCQFEGWGSTDVVKYSFSSATSGSDSVTSLTSCSS